MPRQRRRARALRRAAALAAVVCAATVAGAVPVRALILPPTTVDGPSTDVLALGEVAMAPDGTGGLVYTKQVDGAPHVFASRYDGSGWSAPIRVDWDRPYDARMPRIAADEGGQLLVVWVTQIATFHGEIRRALYSASLDPGASRFGPALLVDPNVGDGAGVDPSLAGTDPGEAIVAYRVVTYDFRPGSGFSPAVQLREGDVMADIRLARLDGDRWSRIGAINRNPSISMRPPGADNGPRVDLAANGGAVAVWQEPEQSGVARVWARRIFGSTPGPVLAASPSRWEDAPIVGDADAPALDVTAFGQVRVAMRVDGRGTALGGSRLLLNTLPPNFLETAGAFTGPVLADGGPAPRGGPGAPSVSASDEGGDGQGSLRLAFAAGSEVRLLGIDAEGELVRVGTPGAATAGGIPVAAVDPDGGGVAAWPSRDGRGRRAVAVRQDFASGSAQSGVLSGARTGPVSGLSIGTAGGGDALIGFRQGEPGRAQIVALRVAAPPAEFPVGAPTRWVPPPRATLRWGVPPSAVGGFRYDVLLDGRVVRRDLRQHRLRPARAHLGSGVRNARVLATDRLGQQFLSRPVKLRVDSRPPAVRVRVRPARGRVVVRLRDPDSGLRRRSALCRFGDGARVRRRPRCRHAFERPGRYAVLVRASDRVGNRVVRRFLVRVR